MGSVGLALGDGDRRMIVEKGYFGYFWGCMYQFLCNGRALSTAGFVCEAQGGSARNW